MERKSRVEERVVIILSLIIYMAPTCVFAVNEQKRKPSLVIPNNQKVDWEKSKNLRDNETFECFYSIPGCQVYVRRDGCGVRITCSDLVEDVRGTIRCVQTVDIIKKANTQTPIIAEQFSQSVIRSNKKNREKKKIELREQQESKEQDPYNIFRERYANKAEELPDAVKKLFFNFSGVISP